MGPGAPGHRACQGQPDRVYARSLSDTLPYSARFVQRARNVKDPDPLLATRSYQLSPPAHARARTQTLSKFPGRSGRIGRCASLPAARAQGAACSPPPLRPRGGERQAGRRGKREYKRRAQRKVGESDKGGEGGRGEMRSLMAGVGWGEWGGRGLGGGRAGAGGREKRLPGPIPNPPLLLCYIKVCWLRRPGARRVGPALGSFGGAHLCPWGPGLGLSFLKPLANSNPVRIPLTPRMSLQGSDPGLDRRAPPPDQGAASVGELP